VLEIPKSIETALQLFMALLGAFIAAFWFTLVVWTFRDIQKRTHDVIAQVLGTLLVLFLNLPGLLLYRVLRPPETLEDAYARKLEEESLAHEIEERQSCPNCHYRVQSDYVLCPNCHLELKRVCANCQRLLQQSWDICPYCGQQTPQ
jgi:RNA polymerase subunit RPABC4/transcription elongation factor Spt4